jgi:hypothetical protein
MQAGCWLDAGWMLARCRLDAGWMLAGCWLDADWIWMQIWAENACFLKLDGDLQILIEIEPARECGAHLV